MQPWLICPVLNPLNVVARHPSPFTSIPVRRTLEVMGVSRLICFVRDHDWETVTDAGGALTTCTRCGTIRHDDAPSSAPRIDDSVKEARRASGAEGGGVGGR